MPRACTNLRHSGKEGFATSTVGLHPRIAIPLQWHVPRGGRATLRLETIDLANNGGAIRLSAPGVYTLTDPEETITIGVRSGEAEYEDDEGNVVVKGSRASITYDTTDVPARQITDTDAVTIKP